MSREVAVAHIMREMRHYATQYQGIDSPDWVSKLRTLNDAAEKVIDGILAEYDGEGGHD